MTDLEQTVAALAERVAALEAENARLRMVSEPDPALHAAGRAPSRRSLLVGGAGLLGTFAASNLLGPGRAAAAPTIAASHVVQARQYANPHVLATIATLVPQRGGGHHWARYVWDMSGSFAGTEPPAVLAAASDDYHGSGERAEPTIAVALHREAGTWQAEILVNHVGHLATEVTLHAIAFGSAE
jgi:hypothetical protein